MAKTRIVILTIAIVLTGSLFIQFAEIANGAAG